MSQATMITESNILQIDRRAKQKFRIDSLDWLRGVLAAAIMVYHLTCWLATPPDAGTLLGRVGIYGVGMFFVLSGLSLASNYAEKMNSWTDVASFLIKRALRILPLLWIAIGAAYAQRAIGKGSPPSFWDVIGNLTCLYSFTNPSAYLNVGAWSIGNEVVYYALTPIYLKALQLSRPVGRLILFLSVVVALHFSSDRLKPTSTLELQWATYVNPLTNLPLYCAGMFIGVAFRARSWRKNKTFLFGVIATGLFFGWPAHGDLIATVTGITRIILMGASVMVVLCVYSSSMSLSQSWSSILGHLGTISYGVYLLHPLVFSAIRPILKGIGFDSALAIGSVTAVLTMLLADLVWRSVEHPMIALGQRLTTRLTNATRHRCHQDS